MRIGSASRFALAAAAALLVSCGPTPPLSPSSISPAQNRAWQRAVSPATSPQQRDLLYVSNANGTVNVYRYWQHFLNTVLTNFSQPMGECTDRSSDVYITDKKTDFIAEYAHGGKRPLRVIKESPYMPQACAVAPSSGNLAIANFSNGYSTGTPGTVAVYRAGTGKPVIYQALENDHFVYCAYDDRGDLLALSQNYYYYYFFFNYYFYYLPKGASKLIRMDVPGPSSSGSWNIINDIAWDGTYWVVADEGSLYRFTIDIKAKHIDTIQLTGGFTPGGFGALAFYRKTPTSPAIAVVETTFSTTTSKVAIDYWNYPAGGNPFGQITKYLDSPSGIAISRGTQ